MEIYNLVIRLGQEAYDALAIFLWRATMKEYKTFNQQLTVLRNRKSDRLIYILYFGDLLLFIANYINLKNEKSNRRYG